LPADVIVEERVHPLGVGGPDPIGQLADLRRRVQVVVAGRPVHAGRVLLEPRFAVAAVEAEVSLLAGRCAIDLGRGAVSGDERAAGFDEAANPLAVAGGLERGVAHLDEQAGRWVVSSACSTPGTTTAGSARCENWTSTPSSTSASRSGSSASKNAVNRCPACRCRPSGIASCAIERGVFTVSACRSASSAHWARRSTSSWLGIR